MRLGILSLLLILALLPSPLAAQLPESVGEWKTGDWKQFVTFEVKETAGLDRQQEPVEVQVRLPGRDVRVVRWTNPPEEIVSQVVEAQADSAAFKLRIAFPATVPARSTVLYRIYFNHPTPPPAAYSTPLKVTARDRVGWVIENQYYVADSSARPVKEKQEDSGQVRALTLKANRVTLLRTPNRMHWAPNFQRKGASSYTGMPQWEPVQHIERIEGPVVCETHRWGFNSDYPEIALDGTYRFFNAMPYFLFRSEMTMTQPIELFLLRNDEMTMDSFFTHVAWPGKTPQHPVQAARFEDREKILATDPIPADAPWVCFFNVDKNYGFGSVRLKFEVKNQAGKPSPLVHPYTKISDGANDGKYWNRRLIDERNTMVPGGSRYFEENAYVVFATRPGGPAQAIGEFLDWEKRLSKPLVAEMQGTKAWQAKQPAKAIKN